MSNDSVEASTPLTSWIK